MTLGLSLRGFMRSLVVVLSVAALPALLLVSLVGGNKPVSLKAATRADSNGVLTCGSWGQAGSSDATALAFAKYGGISECGFTGGTWVIFTQGVANPASPSPNIPPPASATWSKPPSVASYRCQISDSSCLDPSTAHAFSNWSVVTAPVAGFMHLIGNPYPGMIIVDIDGSQLWLNVQTLQWSASSLSSEVDTCAKLWGQEGGMSTSPASIQMQFLASNPGCVTAS
jgi:hypothetical protein